MRTLDIGDRITGTYTVDPSVVGVRNLPGVVQYPVYADWNASFPDQSYSFTGPLTVIRVENDASFAGGYDSYIATMRGATGVGVSLPSGRALYSIQLDVDEIGPPPTLLSDDSIQVVPPDY